MNASPDPSTAHSMSWGCWKWFSSARPHSARWVASEIFRERASDFAVCRRLVFRWPPFAQTTWCSFAAGSFARSRGGDSLERVSTSAGVCPLTSSSPNPQTACMVILSDSGSLMSLVYMTPLVRASTMVRARTAMAVSSSDKP